MEHPDRSLLSIFDDEVHRARQYGHQWASPGQALRLLQAALDATGDRAGDDARWVLETVRTCLTALDAVAVHQPPAPREPEGGLLSRSLRRFGGPEPPPMAPAPPTRMSVDVDRVIETVRNALESADRARKAAEPPEPEIVVRPWTEDGELVDLFHDLITAVHDRHEGFAIRRIEQLRDQLALRHDVLAVTLAPDQGNAAYFTVVPHLDLAEREPRTTRPALVRAGSLLRAGEARIPHGPGPTATPYPANPYPAAPEISDPGITAPHTAAREGEH